MPPSAWSNGLPSECDALPAQLQTTRGIRIILQQTHYKSLCIGCPGLHPPGPEQKHEKPKGRQVQPDSSKLPAFAGSSLPSSGPNFGSG